MEPEKRIILLLISTLTDNIRCAEKRAASVDDSACISVRSFFPERRTLGHQDMSGLLQSLDRLNLSGFVKTALLILANLTDHLVVEVLDRMEMVKDRPDMRAALLKGFLSYRRQLPPHRPSTQSMNCIPTEIKGLHKIRLYFCISR